MIVRNFDSWMEKKDFPILYIKYEYLWENIDVVNKFLGFEIDLPVKKNRVKKSILFFWECI